MKTQVCLCTFISTPSQFRSLRLDLARDVLNGQLSTHWCYIILQLNQQDGWQNGWIGYTHSTHSTHSHFVTHTLMEHTHSHTQTHLEQQIQVDHNSPSVPQAKEQLARLTELGDQIEKSPQTTVRDGMGLLRSFEQQQGEAGASGWAMASLPFLLALPCWILNLFRSEWLRTRSMPSLSSDSCWSPSSVAKGFLRNCG